jgi:tetratricopeptide (TPR) repeat protein
VISRAYPWADVAKTDKLKSRFRMTNSVCLPLKLCLLTVGGGTNAGVSCRQTASLTLAPVMSVSDKLPPAPNWIRPDHSILTEADSDLALELWSAVRRLRKWIATPPTLRPSQFSGTRPDWIRARQKGAEHEAPELEPVLQLLADLPCSAQANTVQLGAASYTVAEWARAKGYVETSIQYAEAAALIGGKAEQVLLAAQLTRNAGDFGRAELWFDRGIAAAHAQGNQIAIIRGHLGYGILCMTVGRDACARRHYNTASVYAMQEGFEWLAAEAQHDLFHFMVVRGDLSAAELHARRALRWYPKHHSRIPFLAVDLGFWLVCLGQYQLARTLLPEALRVMKPADTVLGTSILTRAFAGAGQFKESERTMRRLETLLLKHKEFEAAARWNLAEAHRAFGRIEQAYQSAELSLELAQAGHDPETEAFVRDLLDQLAAQAPARPQEAEGTTYLPLVSILLQRIKEWSPNRRGRPRSLGRQEWAA